MCQVAAWARFTTALPRVFARVLWRAFPRRSRRREPFPRQTHARHRGAVRTRPGPRSGTGSVSMVGAAPEPDAKPPSAGEVGALRTKLATLSAINGALRDENDELRRAVEEASDAGGTAGSDVERRLADAEETVASLTRQRDELEAHLLDRSEDDSETNARLADTKRRNRDREKELERAAREIGVLQGERRKLELATADARRERGAAEQKLVRAEENARFARGRHEAETRDAEALLEDLRRRLTRSERDAKAERASLLTQLEAAQSATAAALGEEAQTAVADAEARARESGARRRRRVPPRRRTPRRRRRRRAAANEIRGAESRARDAESGGTSFDEALASAVAETARAAERNRRELARARTELENESRSRARLEKELEEDRAQCSAKIEELERESRQGSIECQAALRAVRDRASAAEADATRAETRVVELTDAAAGARATRSTQSAEKEGSATGARRRSRLASTRFAPSSKRRARVSSGSPMNGTGRGRRWRRRARRRASETPLSTFVRLTNPPIALPRYPEAASTIKDPSRYPTVARSAAAASTSPRSSNRRIDVVRNARVRRTRSAPPSETPRRGTPRGARSESRSSRTRASAPGRRVGARRARRRRV